MKHFDDNNNTPDLEAVFQLAKTQVPTPESDLMAAILADAQSVLDENQTSIQSPKSEKQSLWQRFLADVGGWPILTGMATAGIFGLAVGLYGESILGLPLPQLQSSTEIVDPFAGFDLSYLEG